ncbi:MAG: Asp-tRNA(Asn)/Glu-tRNA(Gln) amidotransferase subunit GatC [Anaerolineae bacterium]|nr:Asp-tRNA(Asn)/Glu-tRNA(Gln) amidotransferase subunit GatC [Anaerolineae bacterium]
MSLTKDQVEHIAQLARLDLTEAEQARYAQQLSAILDYFEQLQQVDTGSVDTMAYLQTGDSQLRTDEPHPGLGIDALLSNAPDADARQFRVPPILG